MPHRDIREFDAKRMLTSNLHRFLEGHPTPDRRIVQVSPTTDLKTLVKEHPWLGSTRLVAKPDMLFGRRGKLGLLKLDVDYSDAAAWIEQQRSNEIEVAGRQGSLTHFLLEPFVPHQSEYYFCITCDRDADIVLFSHEGGVDIEDDWSRKVRELRIPAGQLLSVTEARRLVEAANPEDQPVLASALCGLHQLFQECGLAYLEINPLAISDGRLVFLDTVATVDDAAPTSCKKMWGGCELPESFGTRRTQAEDHIRSLDEKSGASLKFTLLNPDGRLWLLISGGGASVIYADTVADLGAGRELANYGEYSGNPSLDETWDYARTILNLMTAKPHPDGKVLIIGGGIANFTDTAKTFAGIIKALHEQQEALRENKVQIFVRRGGPNYKKALELIRACGREINVPVEAYGPETHMTRVIAQGIEALAAPQSGTHQ